MVVTEGYQVCEVTSKWVTKTKVNVVGRDGERNSLVGGRL